MKNITLWLLVLFGCLQMQAQIFTINNCSASLGASTYGPMYAVAAANATNRTAVVYPASQLFLLAGQNLNAAYFDRKTATGSMIGTPNFKIYLKEVAFSDFGAGALDWNAAITNAVLVYDSNPVLNIDYTAGWKSFPFTTNFVYSGTQNLAVFFEYTNPTASTSLAWVYDSTSPCITNTNPNTTKYENNTTGILPTSLTSSDYRRPIIGFDFVVTCPAPTNLSVTNITSTGATLDWNQGETETQWEYAVVPAGSGIPTTTTIVGADDPINLALNPATNYEVYVRSICSANDKSYWLVSAPFATLCTAVNSLLENFDTYATGSSSMPDCWNKLGTGTAYITTGGAFPGSAPNRLIMTTSASTYMHAILPPFSNLSSNTHRLKFKAYSSTEGKTLQVGYQIDLLGATSFVLLEAINIPGTIADNAEEFTIEPFGVPTEIKNLVFRSANGSSTTLYIDDVIWQPTPTCLDVKKLKYFALTDTSATINWISEGEEQAWQYAYGTSDVLDPSTLTPINATTTTATLNNLTPATAYKVWVRSNCMAGEVGEWIGPLPIKTQCTAVTNFYENFDSSFAGAAVDFTDCWQKAGNGTVYVTFGGNTPGTAPNRLYMRANGASIPPTVALAITPKISNLQAETHRLKFKAHSSTANKSMEVGYLQELTEPSTFVLLQSFDLPSTTTASAQEFVVEPVAIPAGITNLVFRNSALTESSIIYIDDVFWEEIPNCFDVSAISLTDFNSTSATLLWEPGSSEIEWQYVYAETSVTDPTTLLSGLVTVNNNPTTVISGLLPSTSYNVWIRSKCGPDAYGNWPQNPMVITTSCAPVTEFNENFDSSPTGSTSSMPTCWTRFGNTGNSYVNSGSNTPASAPNRLYLYAVSTIAPLTTTTATAVMPPVSNLQGGTHHLKFKAFATSANKALEVGYYNKAGLANSFIVIESFALPTTAQEFVYIPQFVPAGIESLVFRNNPIEFSGTATIYIDDVIWEEISNCPMPNAPTATDLTLTTATINWVAPTAAPANGYDYFYTSDLVTVPTVTTTPSGSVGAGITTAALTSLTASTAYKIYVRSNCSTTDSSAWSEAGTFNTLCANVGLPYSIDFESVGLPNLPLCTSTENLSTGNNWETKSNPGFGFTTNVLAYTSNTNAANTWFYTNSVSLVGGTTYSVSYAYGNNSTAFTEKLRVSYGSNANSAAMTTEIANHSTIQQGALQLNTATFTPLTSGAYVIGFNAYSAANQNYLYLDNIMIQEVLSSQGFETNSFITYPNPVKNVLHIRFDQNISDVAVYNLLGQQVLFNNMNANQGQVEMSSLASGTYLVKATTETGTKTIKVIKE